MTRGNRRVWRDRGRREQGPAFTPGGAIKPVPYEGSDALSAKDEYSGFLGAAAGIYRGGRLFGAAGFFGVEVLVGF